MRNHLYSLSRRRRKYYLYEVCLKSFILSSFITTIFIPISYFPSQSSECTEHFRPSHHSHEVHNHHLDRRHPIFRSHHPHRSHLRPTPRRLGKHKLPSRHRQNLPYYPAPPVRRENVKHPPGTGASPSFASPFVFTSTYNVVALSSEVRNGTTPAPGPKDAVEFFNFGINSNTDTICYVWPTLP